MAAEVRIKLLEAMRLTTLIEQAARSWRECVAISIELERRAGSPGNQLVLAAGQPCPGNGQTPAQRMREAAEHHRAQADGHLQNLRTHMLQLDQAIETVGE